jgi:Rieske Fe-S protein
MIQRGRQIQARGTGARVAPDGRPAREQPRWRRDFPIEWKLDEYVSRRDLVKFIVLTSAAFAVGQSWIAIKSVVGGRRRETDQARPIAAVDEIPVGGAQTFRYPENSTPRLLIRTGERNFVAYDQACTHLMCPVVPAVADNRLHCPCHNGWFDLETGQPLAGPPRRALPRVNVEVRGDTVYATGVEDGGA